MTKPASFVLQFTILFGFWLGLSNQYNALFLSMGVVSALLATVLTRPLVLSCFGPPHRGFRPLRRAWRFVVYLGWLVARMVVAGAQIAYFVCHPRMPLRPGIMRFRTGLQSPLARVVLANSITLVPGTLTLRLTGDEYVVHALVPAAADDLFSGEMQRMVGGVFLEAPDDPVTASWDTPTEDGR